MIENIFELYFICSQQPADYEWMFVADSMEKASFLLLFWRKMHWSSSCMCLFFDETPQLHLFFCFRWILHHTLFLMRRKFKNSNIALILGAVDLWEDVKSPKIQALANRGLFCCWSQVEMRSVNTFFGSCFAL